ncbi:MAG: portal protein, partial [Aestuariivirga sp.]
MAQRSKDEAKPAKSDDAAALIAECAKRMRMSYEAEAHNRAAGREDLQMLRGDHWPAHIRQMREQAGRPCLTVNTLPTYLAQVTNDMRQNKIAIKVHPVDQIADPEAARVYQGLIRHIEYDSNADACQHLAGTQAASCGEGYFRLITEFESENSFHQRIKFLPIRNPMTVAFDPFGIQPDGSDRQWYALPDDLPRDVFEHDYPDADPCSFEDVDLQAYREWVQQDTVRVVEYYRIEDKPETLCLVQDGTAKWESDLGEGDECVKKRKSKRRVVRWYKLSAKEILDDTEIPCEWIPIFPVYGAEVVEDGRVYRSSLIRAASDPARMYNVWISAATEEIALRPKVPWVMAEGQDEGYEDMWKTANRVNHDRLIYKPTTVEGSNSVAPPPMRQPMADVPVGVLTMAGHARDDQKAAMGLFDSSMGARGTATSGRQELAQQQQGQITNLHFSDNLMRAVRLAGRCLLSMIPRVYDTPRVVKLLGEDDTLGFAPINTPKRDQQTGAMKVENDLRAGRYDLVAVPGPSFATQRQEAAEGMREMAKAYPPLMQFAGDKMVKAMNWPDGDLIAERLKKTIPPQITEGEDAKDGEKPMQLPPEHMQQMQVMQQQMEQYEQALQDAMQQIKAAQDQNAAEIEKAKAKAGADIEIAKIKALADIEAKRQVAEIEAANR